MERRRLWFLVAGFVLLAVGGWLGWITALEAAFKSEWLSTAAVFIVFALGMPSVGALYTYAVLNIGTSRVS